MKTLKFKQLKASLVRTFFVFCIITLFNFASALPVTASPQRGELKDIEQKAEEVLKEQPRNLKQIEQDAKGGLNEIQGSADRNEMKSTSGKVGEAMGRKIDRKVEAMKK